ncbi:hypothetical protein D3C72_1535270 [compost metagenome]
MGDADSKLDAETFLRYATKQELLLLLDAIKFHDQFSELSEQLILIIKQKN